jgi:hypothetical protein
MGRPTCKTCPYWEYNHGGPDEPDDEAEVGQCHRFPPVFPANEPMVEEAMKVVDGFWHGWQPDTMENEWCGEHPDFPAYIASLKDAPARPAAAGVDEVTSG